MATKYQCEKAIKKLSEQTVQSRNVQGYGIGKAKDYGPPDEKGFVVLTYVANMRGVQKDQAAAKKKGPQAGAVSREVKQSANKKALAPKEPKKRAAAEKPKAQELFRYPAQVETTSRKKKIQIPIHYIETGGFGFS